MTKKKSIDEPAVLIRDALRPEFYQSVTNILQAARSNVYRAVNRVMVEAYWNVGRMIVEEEQGMDRAEYGAYLLRNLALRLSAQFGKGFDERELRKMRQFYAAFPIRDALRPELSWTHYRMLIRVTGFQLSFSQKKVLAPLMLNR